MCVFVDVCVCVCGCVCVCFRVNVCLCTIPSSYVYIATQCLFVCVLVAYLLRNSWTDLAKLFLLALSWSRDGFRPKHSG